MIRSLLAILAGIATLTVTSFAIEAIADPLMMRLFPHSLPTRAAISYSAAATLFMFVFTAACVAAGGYVTAWIARRSPVLHALIMGIVQEALTVWAMLSIGREAPPRNWIGALVFIIPVACLGGMLRARYGTKAASQQQLSHAGATWWRKFHRPIQSRNENMCEQHPASECRSRRFSPFWRML